VKEALMHQSKMLEFRSLVEKHAVANVGIETPVKDFFIYKGTKSHKQKKELYDSGLILMAAGTKRINLNGQVYDYSAGKYLGVFLPMPVEVEEVSASPDNPILLVGLKMELSKVAEILLQIDRLTKSTHRATESTGLFTAAIQDDLLDPVIRLLKILDNATDVAMLSQSIIDEIYYRVLTGPQVSNIRSLLEQRGQIQQISRAVEYINKHIDTAILIEDLADKANMSVSHFHKNFKDVMQMPPLQYAKSMKLFKAQALISEGKKASKEAYMVGYNSTAQFSREYKRQFGFAPSETLSNVV